MSRRKSRENIRALDRLGELRVGHAFDLAAEQDLIGLNADFLAYFARDEIIVTGQDFDGHAMLPENGDGLGGGVFRWIQKSQAAGQYLVGFISL